MRFMTFVKSAERSGPTPLARIEAVANPDERRTPAALWLDPGRDFPTPARKLTVTDGPFTETKEVLGRMAP
jgi:hypothetical protein